MNLDRTFFKKQWSNILMVLIIVLLMVPQTGIPIKVAIQRVFALAPEALSKQEQLNLDTYQWPLRTLVGKDVNFIQSKGEVVLVNFWATWCPPCIAEMPAFQNLFDLYGAQVDFYFIAKESAEKLNAFMKNKGYDLPVYIQEYDAPEAIQSDVLPTTVVINKRGEVVLLERGAKSWDDPEFYSFLDDLIRR